MARGGDARERTVTLAGEGARGGGGDATRSGERRSGEQQDGDGEDDGEDDGDTDGDGDGDKDKDGDKDVLHVLIVPARVAFGFCVEGERGRARANAPEASSIPRARERVPVAIPEATTTDRPRHPRGAQRTRTRRQTKRRRAPPRARGSAIRVRRPELERGREREAFARSAARRRELERRPEASATSRRIRRVNRPSAGTPAYEDLWARAKALGAIQRGERRGGGGGRRRVGRDERTTARRAGGEARVGDLAARVSDLAARAESIVSDEDDDDEEDDDELSLDLDVDPFERHSVRTVAGEAENAPERDLLSELDRARTKKQSVTSYEGKKKPSPSVAYRRPRSSYLRPTLPRHLVSSLVRFERARSLRRRLRSLRRRLRRLVAAEPARRRDTRRRPPRREGNSSVVDAFLRRARATLHLRARHRGEERHPFHRLPGTRSEPPPRNPRITVAPVHSASSRRRAAPTPPASATSSDSASPHPPSERRRARGRRRGRRPARLFR